MDVADARKLRPGDTVDFTPDVFAHPGLSPGTYTVVATNPGTNFMIIPAKPYCRVQINHLKPVWVEHYHVQPTASTRDKLRKRVGK